MKLRDLFEKQKVIEGDVVVSSSKTTKFNYEGVIVKGNFYGHSTAITSLIGAPSYVGGDFYCNNTYITSLEGAPSYVGGNFNCSFTEITSLHNIHKQIKHIGGTLDLSNTIKSHVLGVMFIKGLKEIGFFIGGNKQLFQAIDIINKHLKGNHNPHEAQEELIEAGLSEYAKI